MLQNLTGYNKEALKRELEVKESTYARLYNKEWSSRFVFGIAQEIITSSIFTEMGLFVKLSLRTCMHFLYLVICHFVVSANFHRA